MKKFYTLVLTVFFSVLSFGQNDKSWIKMGTSQNKSFYEVQTNFNKYWDKKTPEKGQGYKIFKRWENQISDKIYPSGDMSLPSNTYPNFIAWQKEYNDKKSKNTNVQMKASVAPSNWTSLNPASIATGYDSGSGRINFVTFDPVDAQKMFVGAPDGGLWKTVDGGGSWTTNSDYLPIIGCAGLVIDPTTTTYNPHRIMYLATGDRESDRKSIGVLKSTDGGANWNTTGLVWTVGANGAASNYKITKIVMDPNNPLIMLIATDGGIFRTTDGWATVQNINPLSSETIYDIEYMPGSSTIVYAAGRQIYKSIDGGETWTANASSALPNPTTVERIELAVTTADNTYVYAIIGRSSDQGFEGLYRSVDSGVTYTKQSDANTPNILHTDAAPTAASVGGQASHDLAIAVSPVNKDLITIGGINQWQSTDGGASWTRITYWLGKNGAYPTSHDDDKPYIHADIIYIAYSPHDNTTLYTTCDGGISKGITNGQDTWVDITANIAVGQQTSITQSLTDGTIFFAGLQDIGSIKYTNGAWKVISGGDGEDGFIDRTNPEFIVSSTTNGQFFYSTDGGTTKHDMPWPTYQKFTSDNSEAEWFSPIKQDPGNVNHIYIGGRPDLYKCTDLFTAIANNGSATYAKTGTTPPQAGKNILRFEIAPSNNQIIYAITENRLSKSTNSGLTWTNITGNLPVADASLKNLTVSNTDANKVWVVFSGYAAGKKVYKTVDGGANWTNVSLDLPNIPMNTIVYRNGSANDEVYIGADLGVYAIDNVVTSAVPFLTNLPKCSVQDLEISYNASTNGKLRAATYGRGSWETELSAQTLATHEIAYTDDKVPVVYPNPVTNGVLNIKLVDKNAVYDYYLYNMLGEQVHKGTLSDSNSTIPVADRAAGTYILRMISSDTTYTQKIIIK